VDVRSAVTLNCRDRKLAMMATRLMETDVQAPAQERLTVHVTRTHLACQFAIAPPFAETESRDPMKDAMMATF
jgi:hypothetical protein